MTTVFAIGAYLWARKIEREKRIESAWNYFRDHDNPTISSDPDGSVWLSINIGDKVSDIFKESTLKALHDLDRIDGIQLVDPRKLTDDQYCKLFSLPEVKQFYFQGKFLPSAARNLSRLKRLEDLQIGYQLGQDEDFPETLELKSMSSLKEMQIEWPEEIIIHSMPKLKALCLNNCGVSGNLYNSTITLNTCEQLESLDLFSGLFSKISTQPRLKSLKLSNVCVCSHDIDRLKSICSLRALSLANCAISAEAINSLKKFDTLQELSIDWNIVLKDMLYKNPQQLFENSYDRVETLVNKRDLSPLKECKSMTSLTLACEMDYVEEIRFLSQMSNLRKLDIADLKVKSLAGGHRKLFLSEIIEELGSVSFLDELIVGNIDIEESKIKAAFPKTKVILK